MLDIMDHGLRLDFVGLSECLSLSVMITPLRNFLRSLSPQQITPPCNLIPQMFCIYAHVLEYHGSLEDHTFL